METIKHYRCSYIKAYCVSYVKEIPLVLGMNPDDILHHPEWERFGERTTTIAVELKSIFEFLSACLLMLLIISLSFSFRIDLGWNHTLLCTQTLLWEIK